MATNQHVSEASIKQMNSFLRGEIAAVETYEQALAQHPGLDGELRGNLESHRTRANNLRHHIRDCGGTPDDGSGAWGSFAKALESMASKVGATQAISQLQDGEHHGTKSFERNYEDLDPCCREFTQEHLLPEQRKTQEHIDRVLAAHEN